MGGGVACLGVGCLPAGLGCGGVNITNFLSKCHCQGGTRWRMLTHQTVVLESHANWGVSEEGHRTHQQGQSTSNKLEDWSPDSSLLKSWWRDKTFPLRVPISRGLKTIQPESQAACSQSSARWGARERL